MKPHIRLIEKLWYCVSSMEGGICMGIGYTAKAAYQDWAEAVGGSA